MNETLIDYSDEAKADMAQLSEFFALYDKKNSVTLLAHIVMQIDELADKPWLGKQLTDMPAHYQVSYILGNSYKVYYERLNLTSIKVWRIFQQLDGPLLPKPIKIRLDNNAQIEQMQNRLRAGAWEVIGWTVLQLPLPMAGITDWVCVWVSELGHKAITEIENFHDKGSNRIWDSNVKFDWTYDIPDDPLRGRPLDKSILRLDLHFTRADGNVRHISLWFDIQKHLELLDNIASFNNLWLGAEKPDFQKYISRIPPVALDADAIKPLNSCIRTYSTKAGIEI